jgi:L-threonylcarbamoyladenylate synthase
MNFTKDIEQCLQILQSGGVILYPTDTVWGLGCDATNEAAVAKIFEIKQRPAQKSMVVLVVDQRAILQYTAAPDMAVFDYLQTVKKPTTVIYEHAVGLAENVLNTNGSVGIRLVKEDFCMHLIKRFRKPIVSTSANISNETTPRIFSEISDAIKRNVDYIVNYRQDDNTLASPSSVIRWKNGTADVIRS